jgi:heme exporter protein B
LRFSSIFAQTYSISSARHIFTLFKKDLLLEVRQQYSFYGILLYIGSTIFVLFMAMNEPESKVWKRFVLGHPVIYLYQCRCQKFFTGKPRPHALFLFHCQPCGFCIGQIAVQLIADARDEYAESFSFTLFLGNPIQKAGPFIGLVLLGGWSLSLVFTF